MLPVIYFEIDRNNALDLIDRLDNLKNTMSMKLSIVLKPRPRYK
jgi:hypothetical protein